MYGMTQIGRDYYDMSKTYPLPKYNLELVLGFMTAIASHEMKLMLCAEVSHRLMSTLTVQDLMVAYYRKDTRGFKEECTKNIIGQIVMTK